MKDANDMLVAGRGKEVIEAMWGAKAFRPDGIVSVSDIIEDIKKPVQLGRPWCFPSLTEATYGRRPGEVYGIGAGTGVGKTDFMTQQIAFDVTELGIKCGVIYLEQKPAETGKRIAGKIAKRRFHVPDSGWTQDELDNTLSSLDGKVFFYDSFGETEWDVVKAKIRYMAVALKVEHIYLDHLTAMADTTNEKESLEQIMKEMAGIANELGIIIHFVSHLSTPEGKSHEEGGRVTIRHFKGSRAIGFWCYFMFGLERDQQAENEKDRQLTTFRILKDRYTGQATGKVFYLLYDATTGLLEETNAEDFGFGNSEGEAPSDF
jgi:twinkle protein